MKLQRMNTSLIFMYMFFCIGAFSYAQSKTSKLANPDSLKNKSIIVSDSIKTVPSKSTIQFIKVSAILDSNFYENVITRNNFETIDYRFTEDLLMASENVFVKKLGAGGTPTEVNLYGLNTNATAFLNDGISITNRLTNFTNLHLVQSENIEAIEFIPLSRGFLFGNSNTASVNFISRDVKLNKPYSRLKYFQAANGEGFIDAIFNIMPINKLKTYIQLTNHVGDSYFTNSRFSNWQANVRLNYLLTPTETILIDYKHVKSNSGLFGGVDIDSTKRRYPNFSVDDIVYDNITAVVRFANRYLINTNNYFAATVLTKSFTKNPAEISLYFKDDLAEFRQNISGNVSENLIPVSHDNISQTYGARVRHDYSTQFVNLNTFANFEKSKFTSPLFEKTITQTSFSASGIATIKIADDRINPSGFVKYLNLSQKSYLSFGGDAVFNLSNTLSFYGGLSNFEKPVSPIDQKFYVGKFFDDTQKIQTIEAKANVKFSNLNLGAGYFYITNSNELISAFKTNSKLNDAAYFVDKYESKTQGLSLSANINIWKIHFNTYSIIYLGENERINNGLPKFNSSGGIYYIDTLFNRNLKMKTGFNYYSVGSRYQQYFDFEKAVSSSYLFNTNSDSYSLINPVEFSNSFQLDFFFAGRIRDKAIVYITWENLLNAKFFTVANYPVRPRGLRFGVAWEFLD